MSTRASTSGTSFETAVDVFLSQPCFSKNTDYLTKRWHAFITNTITDDTYQSSKAAVTKVVDQFYTFLNTHGEEYCTVDEILRVNEMLIHLVSAIGTDFELLDDLFTIHDSQGYTSHLIESVGRLTDPTIVQNVYQFLPCHRIIEAIKTSPHLNSVDFKSYIPQIPRIVEFSLELKETLDGAMDMAFFAVLYARAKLWDSTGSLSDNDVLCLSYLRVLWLLDGNTLDRPHTGMPDKESLAIIDLLYHEVCASKFDVKGMDTYLSTCQSVGAMPSFEQWCTILKMRADELNLAADIDYAL